MSTPVNTHHTTQVSLSDPRDFPYSRDGPARSTYSYFRTAPSIRINLQVKTTFYELFDSLGIIRSIGIELAKTVALTHNDMTHFRSSY